MLPIRLTYIICLEQSTWMKDTISHPYKDPDSTLEVSFCRWGQIYQKMLLDDRELYCMSESPVLDHSNSQKKRIYTSITGNRRMRYCDIIRNISIKLVSGWQSKSLCFDSFFSWNSVNKTIQSMLPRYVLILIKRISSTLAGLWRCILICIRTALMRSLLLNIPI